MRREQISQVRGDCTASYSISDYKAKTIGEFVDEVLAECRGEWGYFTDENFEKLEKPEEPLQIEEKTSFWKGLFK